MANPTETGSGTLVAGDEAHAIEARDREQRAHPEPQPDPRKPEGGSGTLVAGDEAHEIEAKDRAKRAAQEKARETGSEDKRD